MLPRPIRTTPTDPARVSEDAETRTELVLQRLCSQIHTALDTLQSDHVVSWLCLPLHHRQVQTMTTAAWLHWQDGCVSPRFEDMDRHCGGDLDLLSIDASDAVRVVMNQLWAWPLESYVPNAMATVVEVVLTDGRIVTLVRCDHRRRSAAILPHVVVRLEIRPFRQSTLVPNVRVLQNRGSPAVVVSSVPHRRHTVDASVLPSLSVATVETDGASDTDTSDGAGIRPSTSRRRRMQSEPSPMPVVAPVVPAKSFTSSRLRNSPAMSASDTASDTPSSASDTIAAADKEGLCFVLAIAVVGGVAALLAAVEGWGV